MAGKSNTGMFFTMVKGAIFRRRSRAIMAVVASIVGSATLFCLAAVCIAVPQQMNDQMRAYGANLIVTAIEGDGQKTGIGPAMVKHTTEMVEAKGAIANYATYRYENVRINASPYVMAGISPTQVRRLNQHWSVDGSWPKAGNVLVGRDVADAMGLTIGSRIKIAYRAADNVSSASPNSASSNSAVKRSDDGRASTDILQTDGTEFRVGGIVDTGGSEDQIVYATESDLAALAGTKRGVDVIEYSSSATGAALTGIVDSINDMTSMHVKAQTVTKITSSDTRIITMLQTLFWIVSLVVLTLTLVGVSTTISSIVSNRSYEIGLRKALGASSASIGAEFYVESAFYGLLGGLLGTAIGYGFARVLTATVFGHTLGLNGPLAVGSVLLSVVVAVLASVIPVRRASRINPAVILREE